MIPSWLLITLTILLLAALLPTTHANTCNVGYSSTCDSVAFTATSNVFFHVNHTDSNKDVETYNATVIFHWDLENITESSKAYKIGDPFGLTNTFEFTKEGYYNVGYSVIFEDDAAAGCSGETFGSLTVIKMERTPNRCVWGAETPKPTISPSISMSPTVSSGPTGDTPVGSIDGSNGVGGGMVACRFCLFVGGSVAAIGSLWF